MKRFHLTNKISRHDIDLTTDTYIRQKQKRHGRTYETYPRQYAQQFENTTEIRANMKTKHNRKMNRSYPPMRSEDPDP